MSKIDFKKEMKEFYSASAKAPCIIKVPKLKYFMVDGKGDPNKSQEFQEGVKALFTLSYTIKFKIKKEQKIDYGVLPLEGLWWVPNMDDFSAEKKDDWFWTAMIMQPEYVTKAIVNKSIPEVKEKKDIPALDKVRFEEYAEGSCAQIMHLGPFSEEKATIEKLHNFISESGYIRNGKHHEIYLSDISKANPSKWRTILRQPISKE